MKNNNELSAEIQNGNLDKPMLCDVLKNIGFCKITGHPDLWIRRVYNESGCQFSIYIRLLNDNETIRISVSEKDTDQIEAVDLFETKKYSELSNFFNVVG